MTAIDPQAHYGCGTCGGTGRGGFTFTRVSLRRDDPRRKVTEAECPDCHGRGWALGQDLIDRHLDAPAPPGFP